MFQYHYHRSKKFTSYEFLNITFKNTNAFRFFDLQGEVVPLVYSRREKEVFWKVMFCTKLRINSKFQAKYLVFGEGNNWKNNLVIFC